MFPNPHSLCNHVEVIQQILVGPCGEFRESGKLRISIMNHGRTEGEERESKSTDGRVHHEKKGHRQGGITRPWRWVGESN